MGSGKTAVPISSPLGWWVDALNLGETYEKVLWERWEMGASSHPHPSYPQKIRFDAGSGMATIRHPTALRLGEFHTVRLLRNLTWGSLGLDGHPAVNGTSQVSAWGAVGWGQGAGGGAHPLVPAGEVPRAGSERGAVPGRVPRHRRCGKDGAQPGFHG